MTVKIRIADRVFTTTQYIPSEQFLEVKEYLKRLGFRWNAEAKQWERDELPQCGRVFDELKAKLGLNLPCKYDVKVHKNFVYVPEDLITDFSQFEYTLTKYKRVSCEEYCAQRARNYERCIERCESEEWKPVMRVEEVVRLWARTEDGKIRIPRGLAHKLNIANMKFTEPFVPDTYQGLREYQKQVGEALLRFAESYGGGIAVMATGSGKSYMAGWLAKQLIRHGYNVIVTSLSIDLTNQLRDFANRWGAKVHAYTIQTLYRRLLNEDNGNNNDSEDEEYKEVLEYMDEQDLSKQELDTLHSLFFNRKTAVIIDEAHHVPARMVKAVSMNVGDGWGLRFGLTATPYRNDGKELEIEAWVGGIVEPRISSSYLIQHGFAVPVTIKMIKTGNWKCKAKEDANPARAFASVRKCLAENTERNKFIVDLVEQAPKPTMVLTSLVSHAETLYRLIKSRIQNTALATGVIKGSEREAIFNAVRNGKVDVLVATTLADEGLDLPPLRSLIVALGGRSKTRVPQRIGRLVRPYPGKTMAIAYDIWDSADFFENQGAIRKELYETEPYWKVEIAHTN